jgi:hypothetical protein
MSRLSLSGRVTKDYLRSMLFDLMRDIELKVNGLAEGRLAARHNAYTAPPTTGTHAVGDFVRNSAPAVAGAPGSQYVILGWLCTVSGEPGTWVQCRTLTGT